MRALVCVLLLVALCRDALAQDQPIPSNNDAGPRIDKTTALTCPSSRDDGVIDIVSIQPSGLLLRTRVFYKASLRTRVELTQESPGTPFGDAWLNVDLATETNPDVLSMVNFIADQATKIKHEVCDGSDDDRIRFDAIMKANEASLHRQR